MSNDDDPLDQKRGDRTIIRINPGGRQTAPRGDSSNSSRAGIPDTNSDPKGAASEEWIRSTAHDPNASQTVDKLPEINLDDLVAPNDNQIMQAAGPVLLLLGRLQTAVLRAPFAGLMEQVAEAMRFFETDIRSAGIPEEQARSAKYILCATADDIVQNIPTDDRHVWTRYSMLARFFNERTGGVRFFDEVDRVRMDPLRNFPLLELQYTCLALGFQGLHRTSANGQATLQQLQRQLYETVRQVKPRLERELSPRWQGLMLDAKQGWRRVPAWVAWAFAGLMLFGIYIVLRLLLANNTAIAVEHLRAMQFQEPLTLERRRRAEPPQPPPPSPPVKQPVKVTQLQRIRTALQSEIAAGKVDAVQPQSMIIIRVGDLVLFPSSKATVLPQFAPIGARIAAALDNEPRHIRIIGHTDNTPLSSASRFSSNLQLSIERAKAVAEVLRSHITDRSRIIVDGRGDEEPLGGSQSNKTPEGRAKNRRVDIMLEPEE